MKNIIAAYKNWRHWRSYLMPNRSIYLNYLIAKVEEYTGDDTMMRALYNAPFWYSVFIAQIFRFLTFGLYKPPYADVDYPGDAIVDI